MIKVTQIFELQLIFTFVSKSRNEMTSTPQYDESRSHLMTRVAWMYFIDGMKQEEIANTVGLSRIKVNRLLAAAREEGLVKIDIRGMDSFRSDMTSRLRDAFGLQEVHIVPRSSDSKTAIASVGFSLGSYLSDRLTNGMTVGVAGSYTTNALVAGLKPQSLPELNIVGLKGCIANEGKVIPHETVARFAYALDANAYQLAAPGYARTNEEHRLFTELPLISHVIDRGRNANIALLTVSRVVENGGLVGYGFLSALEIQSLKRAGAVAGVLGVFVDREGRAVDHPLNERQIGLDLDDLRRIPTVILPCAGEGKAEILMAALKTGVAHVLFTDEATAEAVVNLL